MGFNWLAGIWQQQQAVNWAQKISRLITQSCHSSSHQHITHFLAHHGLGTCQLAHSSAVCSAHMSFSIIHTAGPTPHGSLHHTHITQQQPNSSFLHQALQGFMSTLGWVTKPRIKGNKAKTPPFFKGRGGTQIGKETFGGGNGYLERLG